MEQSSLITKLRNSGRYPIVDLTFFDSINHIDFSHATLNHHQNTKEFYLEYLKTIADIEDKKQEALLEGIKQMEAIDNHALEKEDSFLLAIYHQLHRESSIDYLLERGYPELTKEAFIEGHKVLLSGTKSDEFAENNYRSNNEAYVGYTEDGNLVINYFPISYQEIEEAMDKLLTFYHDDQFDDLFFVKSQIIHGIIATTQMFRDGNTRYGRILQYLKLFDLTNKKTEYSFSSPALFGTRSYFPFRYQYRELIQKLATSPNNDTWNEWFNFNLNRAEDTMYFMDGKIEQFKKIKV